MKPQKRWVLMKKLAEETGYTVQALRRKAQKGQLAEGIHWRRAPDGRLMFDANAFALWVEQGEAA